MLLAIALTRHQTARIPGQRSFTTQKDSKYVLNILNADRQKAVNVTFKIKNTRSNYINKFLGWQP